MKGASWIDTAVLLLVLAGLTIFNLGHAQQPAPAAAPAAAVEPDAMPALNKMGAYLRALNAFSLRSGTKIDEVTDDGRKLQFSGAVTMQAKCPNGLRVEVDSDRKHRQFIFDGKTPTIYGERIGCYATVPAPATVKELLASLDEKYGIQLPLTDLFHSGTDAKAAERASTRYDFPGDPS